MGAPSSLASEALEEPATSGWGGAIHAALPFLTGVLLFLALPSKSAGPIGFVGLSPLILFSVRRTPGRAFVGGFASGIVLYVLAMPWVMSVMTVYGGLGRATAVLVMLLLHGYLAVYYGLFAWLVSRTAARDLGAALLFAPLEWAGLEWLRGWLFSGFPWISLALTQWKNLPMVQHAAWGGVYTVSAIVVIGSAAVVALALPRTRKLGLFLAALLLVLQGTGALWLRGWDARVASLPRSFRVGVVQAMVPLEERWDEESRESIEGRHFAMSRDLVKQGAQAILWSESSLPVPGGLWSSTLYRERLGRFARRLDVPILLGGIAREDRAGGEKVFNSAFVIDRRGALFGRYDKQHLVPFGEYVPLQKLLFFAEKLVREVGDFGKGEGPFVMRLGTARVGVPICYEIIFPEITRLFVLSGADLLITITNDAWFGRSAAPEQHFANAVFRAVESRRFVIRCANTGISGLVSPAGRVEVRSAIFEPALFIAPVEPLKDITLYARWGDLLPVLGFFLCAVAAVRRSGLARPGLRVSSPQAWATIAPPSRLGSSSTGRTPDSGSGS